MTSFLNTQVDDVVIRNWISNSKSIAVDYDSSIESLQQFAAKCNVTAYTIGALNSGLGLLKAFLIAEHYSTYTLLAVTIFGLLLNFLHLIFGEMPNIYKVNERLRAQQAYYTEIQLFISDLSITIDLKRLTNANINSYAKKKKKLI